MWWQKNSDLIKKNELVALTRRKFSAVLDIKLRALVPDSTDVSVKGERWVVRSSDEVVPEEK